MEDKTVQPKFLLRSLATLRVFLKNTRIATSQRIRNEYERRLLMNQEVVEVLRSNCQLWTLVDGPCVEYLSEPSEEALDRANGAKARLLLMRAQDDIPVSAAHIIDEMIRAVNTLVSADFEQIRIEKFPMTPETLFHGFVKNMKELHSIRKLEAEDLRRQKWLSSLDSHANDEGRVVDDLVNGPDRFGCDPDVFAKHDSNQKPSGFSNAILKASLVHIDEMRTLLEMHYDDVHLSKHALK